MTLTFWEFWNAAFAWLGQGAVIAALACVIDRRAARAVGCFWVAFADAQKQFCDALPSIFRQRWKELDE